jgi:CubicO group peptidase (beta-lactamase class C family)
MKMMDAFPPSPEAQVTLANWRAAPFNRWAFQHVREILPSAAIPNDPADVMKLEPAPANLEIGGLAGETDTDALVVLHKGKLVFEHYANGMTAHTPHILMSVSKSMLGLLCGVLAARRELDPDRLVSHYVPEAEQTAYKGATVRHLLDMRSGIAFDEDYLATTGPIVAYRKATGWNPVEPGDRLSDLRSFYSELIASEAPHGGRFHYVSPNTDLLGWVIERATGRRYADLMSELIWKPVGAERSAYISVDRLGAPRCAGGMCVTARDVARVGHVVAEDGRRGTRQVVPSAWIDDIARNGDRGAWAIGSLLDVFPGLPMRYRSKWYVLDEHVQVLFGWGIHGQHLFVDRRNGIVIAKMSSQAQPVDIRRMAKTFKMVSQIRSALLGDSHSQAR